MEKDSPSILRLMTPNNTQQLIPLQKLTRGLVRKIIRTASRLVMQERRSRCELGTCVELAS